MSTEHVGARPALASALVTAIDHVGIAVPDLDAAIKWYHDHLGMIVLHEAPPPAWFCQTINGTGRHAETGSKPQINYPGNSDAAATGAGWIDWVGAAG